MRKIDKLAQLASHKYTEYGVYKRTDGSWTIYYASECNLWFRYELFTGSYNECRDKLIAFHKAKKACIPG